MAANVAVGLFLWRHGPAVLTCRMLATTCMMIPWLAAISSLLHGGTTAAQSLTSCSHGVGNESPAVQRLLLFLFGGHATVVCGWYASLACGSFGQA